LVLNPSEFPSLVHPLEFEALLRAEPTPLRYDC